MAQPADVIREMNTLGIGGETSHERSGSNGVSAPDPIGEEIVQQKKKLVEISAMADKMSDLIQQIRETAREADIALRDVEVDLALLRTEEG